MSRRSVTPYGTPNVLVADDDAGFRVMVERLLCDSGYRCECVADGQLAAKRLQEERFDALVADINMQGNRELQLLRAIRGLVPIVLVTGDPTLETAIGALRQSVVDYLVKPVDTDILLGAVRSAVEKSRAMRSLRDAKDELARQARSLSHMDSLLSLPGPTGSSASAPSLERLGARAETLTPREREIVVHRAAGESVTQIAARLDISEHTVRNHFKSIFLKLGVHSQEELMMKMMMG